MKRILPTVAILASLMFVVLARPSAQSAPQPEIKSASDFTTLQATIQTTATKVRPAVVGVRMSRSSGSGCFISEDGWVATAGHVTNTKPGTRCRIVMHGGKMLDAVTYGFHEAMDYGLIKADTKGAKVPFCKLGNSGKVKPGEWLIAMGHPLGPEAGRDAVVRAGRCLTPDNGRSMIVMDAPVISGDSGGPVFNLAGEIVAINQSIQTNNVLINNVTPVDEYKKLLNDLKANKTFGNAARPQWGRGMHEPPEGALTGVEVQKYQSAMALLQKRQLKKAVAIFDELLKPSKRPAGVLYNAACTYSLYSTKLKGTEADKMAETAVKALQRSMEAGWADADHAEQDGDLDPLRERKDFQEWLVHCRLAKVSPVLGFSVKMGRGLKVKNLHPKAPKGLEGIKEGDEIERVGRLRIKRTKDWVKAVIETGITPKDEIKIKRAGKYHRYSVNVPAFGAKVFSQSGARIIRMDEDGLAFRVGLREDDIITHVGDIKVEDTLEFANAMMLSDRNEETTLTIRRGYSDEKVQFSYSTGESSVSNDSNVLGRDDWKQGKNLLRLWSAQSSKFDGAIFAVKQKGKQVAYATAVHKSGLFITKASQIDSSDTIELITPKGDVKATVSKRNDRFDVALLKAEFNPSVVVAFDTKTEFPTIGTMLATLGHDGKTLGEGFVALPPYDTDKMRMAPDPNSPYMGVTGKNHEKGVELTSVVADAPAGKAGFRTGDIITHLDGQNIEGWTEMIAMIVGRKPGEKVKFDILRSGSKQTIEMTLMSRAEALGQKAPSKGTGKPELGIYACRKRKDGGVTVGAVLAGSPAELAGVVTNDVVLKINGSEVTFQKDIDKVVKASKIGESVTLTLLRDDKEVELEIELAEKDAPPPAPNNGRPNVKGPINSRCTHFGRVIQHDAVVLPAQQGSPVVDLDGNVMGFNVARTDRTRTFALPASVVAKLLATWLPK